MTYTMEKRGKLWFVLYVTEKTRKTLSVHKNRRDAENVFYASSRQMKRPRVTPVIIDTCKMIIRNMDGELSHFTIGEMFGTTTANKALETMRKDGELTRYKLKNTGVRKHYGYRRTRP